MSRFSTYIILFILSSISTLVYADIPYCAASQLAVYRVAVESPGMMHLSFLYGIINTSKQACRLHGGVPAVWGAERNYKTVPKGMKGDVLPYKVITQCNHRQAAQLKGKDIIVEPLKNPDFIPATKIVWFSFDDVDTQRFKTLHLILPGLPHHIFTVPYGGDCHGNVSIIHQKNAENWFPIKEGTCDFNRKSQLIYFKKTMQCM